MSPRYGFRGYPGGWIKISFLQNLWIFNIGRLPQNEDDCFINEGDI